MTTTTTVTDTTLVTDSAPTTGATAFTVVHNAHETAVYAHLEAADGWHLLTVERGSGEATTTVLRATGVQVSEHTDLPHLTLNGEWQVRVTGFTPTTGLQRLRAEIAELRREIQARTLDAENSGTSWEDSGADLLGVRADALAHAISVLMHDPDNTIV